MLTHSTGPTAPNRRRLRATALALATVGTLLVAACSTGGDDPTSGTAATTTAGGETTTTGTDDGGEETTTTTEDAPREITLADLEAIMPEAIDIGPDYELTADVEEDDEPSETSDALDQACPAMADFMRDTDGADSDDAAYRKFETADGRNVEVKLDPTPNPNFEEGRIDDVIDAVNSCSGIEVDQDGFRLAIDLLATADSTFGDRGVVLVADMVMTHPELLAPLELKMSSRAFVVGSVAVNIMAGDGVAGATAQDVHVVSGDHRIIDSLAEALEAGVADLQS